MRTWFVWPVLLLALSITPVYADSDIFPHYLRCEYKVDPLGIDVMQPRLTWEVGAKDTAKRGLAQSAYQIVVASSLSQLAENQGDLWDTGQVDSSQSANIVYQGAPLKANMDCFWKVRVWDQNGDVSKWSRPARWSMGLLEKSDWEAQWIQEPLRDDFDVCKWIWFPAGNPKQQAPKETVYFRKSFEIPYVADEALVVMAADDAYTLYLDGEEVISSAAGPDAWDHPQYKSRVRVGSGKHVLAVEAVNEKEGPAGLAGKFMVIYNHTQLVLPTDGSWKVSKQAQAGWMDPSFNDSSWQQAKVLSHVGMNDNPWGVPGDSDNLILSPPPYFAKDIEIKKPVKRAMLYATAHGMFDLFINGEKVGEEFFRPGWSDYRFRLYYNTYDVTADLQQGETALGAYLADGWYSGYIGWGRKRNHYEGQTKIKIQLNVEYEDGSQEIFGTDETWNVMASTPIREADFLHGETFDARRAKDGKTACQAVLAHDQQDEGIALDAYPGVNVKAIEELPAKKVSEPKPGVYVFDLGQNMVGLARLKVQGPKGTKVQLRFAERLNEDGTLYTANLRTARALDTYILSGEGVEVWQPRFTFHGFRYVEVTGYPGHPGLDAVTGIVLHSAIPEAGSFVCSNAMVNQLIHNIDWGMRGNYLELPTDCPQRDERMGWTGDAQVFIRTGTYNKDIASFFTKWIQDLVDSQKPDGSFTDVAPDVLGGSGTAAWADAGIICPYTMYLVYGDTRILETHYADFEEYMTYLKEHSDNLIRPQAGYADWLNLHADTPKDLLGTAYYAYSARLMVEIANALGKEQDAAKYKQLYKDIRAAFIKKYMHGNGMIEGNTQTGYVLAMDNGLIPKDRLQRAIYYLVRDLQVRNYHFSTGFAGLVELLPTLTSIGRNDLAYRLLLNDTFPSWGFEIKMGATTIWERWDGWTPEFGFQDPGMNSFNHYAYGSVGEWIYNTVAGIDIIEPGYKKIRIYPRPGGDFRFVKAKYHSINGWIGSEWYDDRDDVYVMKVSIPPNTTALVHVKARNPEWVTENGLLATANPHVDFVEYEDGYAVFEVGSGHYTFASRK